LNEWSGLSGVPRDLIAHAEQLLEQVNELTLHIGNSENEPRGPVRVGCYTTLAATIIPELWAQTAEHFPLIQLDIEKGTAEVLSQKVLQGRLDMMISYKVGLPMGLISRALFHASPHVALPENHQSSPDIPTDRLTASTRTRTAHPLGPTTGR